MLIFSTIMSLIAACCLLLGLYIIWIDKSNHLNRVFGFICFIVSLWHIAAVIGYSSPSHDVIIMATVFASFVYITFITANLHVGMLLALEKRPTRFMTILLYAPALVCTAFIAAAPDMFFKYTRLDGRWKFSPSYESTWFHLLMLLLAAYSAAFLLLLVLRRKKSASNRERRQLDVIMAAFIATSIIVNLTQFIIPWFRFYSIPDIGPAGHAMYLAGLYYAVFRLRFMRNRLTVSADELIAHISDMVFITDRDAVIISMNKPARTAVDAGSNRSGARRLFDVLHDSSEIVSLFGRLAAGETQSENIRITYRGGDRDMYTDSYVSRIMDEFSDHVGFLVISGEHRGRPMMQAAYRITDREFKVIELCVRGMTNREMARSLDVSLRTVETHLVNIYNKLGVNNRIELMNIAIRFGLVPGVRSCQLGPSTDI